MNDYSILQDIDGLNINIKKKNLKIEKLQVRVKQIKSDVASGKDTSMGAGGDLAKSMLAKAKEERVIKKQTLMNAASGIKTSVTRTMTKKPTTKVVPAMNESFTKAEVKVESTP